MEAANPGPVDLVVVHRRRTPGVVATETKPTRSTLLRSGHVAEVTRLRLMPRSDLRTVQTVGTTRRASADAPTKPGLILIIQKRQKVPKILQKSCAVPI